MTSDTPRDCKHGQLARSCEICEAGIIRQDLEQEVRDLQEKNEELSSDKERWEGMSKRYAEQAEKYKRDLAAANAEREELKRLRDELKRDLAASVVKSRELEAENSKLRSALEIVHFKQEPWQ